MRNGIRFLGLSWTGFLKWVVGVLLATFVIWLGLNDGYRSAEGEKKMPSSTREKSRKDRVKSASESDLTAMERLAAGLSDEELWEGLGKACESCFDANAKRKWRDQPRYAIVLSREMGKGKGETGMKEVSTWIKQRFQGISEEEVTSDAIDFFEMRVRTAAFGGWVSDRPEEAISRFVESRRLEERDWPTVNEGLPFVLNMPRASEREAVEMILRDGFQRMAAEDLETAHRLFSEGVEAWAFNPNPVMEALIQQTSGMGRKEFLADLVKASSWQEVLLREEGIKEFYEIDREDGVQKVREIKGDEDFFDLTAWMPGFPYSPSLEQSLRFNQFDVLLRTRPEEAKAILENEPLGSNLQSEMVVALSLEHQRYYPLLSLLDDAKKPSAVRTLMRMSQDTRFGPITGNEPDRDFDPDVLGLVVDQMAMSPETRAEILADLASWGQEWNATAHDCSHGEE